jgi:hypothetical protein
MTIHDYVTHGRTGRKKLGGRKQICQTFRILPDKCQKIFPDRIYLYDLPPHFSKHHTNFPDVMKFSKKNDRICPIFFIFLSQYCPTVERILPDWLGLPNKLGGRAPPPPARYAHDVTQKSSGNGRVSRVIGRGSRVIGRGSKVEGQKSRSRVKSRVSKVENTKFFSILKITTIKRGKIKKLVLLSKLKNFAYQAV